jgi:hypothetical protein
LRRSAVVLARVLAFIEFADLISGAKASAIEIVQKLTDRYAFQKYPKGFDEINLSKGIEFAEGIAVDVPISKFTIYDTVLVVDTRTHTNASRAIIEDILAWGAKDLGLKYVSGSIKRFAFVNSVTFFTDIQILDVNPAVKNLASKCSAELSKIWQEPVKYEPFSVRVGHDPTARKNGIASFTIEHRAETRFSENKYFSEAPLPTDMHWSLLEDFEKEMFISAKGGNA